MPGIRVRFVAGPGFTGWYIRWWTGSLFQHVEFGTAEGTWIGAHVCSGIQERPANYGNYTREYVYEIPCTEAFYETFIADCRKDIGTKYNVLDIVGLMFQIRTLHKAGEFICSEFCTIKLLKWFGAKLVLNTLSNWAYRITPQTLHLSPIFEGNRVKP